MKLAIYLLIAHGLAVLFSIAGLLIALPNPALWENSAAATQMFSFGMQYAGSLHIVIGAAAMFAFGVATIGTRRTLVFFAASMLISLGCELLGTRTGWPFGAYEYTDHLGPKVLGSVPLSIPLSWFALGLTSYMLASRVLAALTGRTRSWAVVALGAWFLTVWDLVLDPAMAHESLPVKFWIWHRTGPYFGMPIQNFIGWAATGALFMAVSRAVWGAEPDPRRIPALFPLAIYAINMGFAVALSISVGLWLPVVLAVVLGLAPALLALAPFGRATKGRGDVRLVPSPSFARQRRADAR